MIRDILFCTLALSVAVFVYLQCDPGSVFAPVSPSKEPGAFSSPERVQHVLEDYDRMLADPRFAKDHEAMRAAREQIVTQGVVP